MLPTEEFLQREEDHDAEEYTKRHHNFMPEHFFQRMGNQMNDGVQPKSALDRPG